MVILLAKVNATVKIEIIPPNPTPNDNISIELSGDWPTSCVPQDPQVSILGNEIHIATSNPTEVCLQIISGWAFTVSIGQLAAGIYWVIVTYSSPGQQLELGREVFTVASVRKDDFNSDGKPDLVWQNRATGQVGVWFMDGTTLASISFFNPGQVADTNWKIVPNIWNLLD
jgi:hypothetical protein